MIDTQSSIFKESRNTFRGQLVSARTKENSLFGQFDLPFEESEEHSDFGEWRDFDQQGNFLKSAK